MNEGLVLRCGPEVRDGKICAGGLQVGASYDERFRSEAETRPTRWEPAAAKRLTQSEGSAKKTRDGRAWAREAVALKLSDGSAAPADVQAAWFAVAAAVLGEGGVFEVCSMVRRDAPKISNPLYIISQYAENHQIEAGQQALLNYLIEATLQCPYVPSDGRLELSQQGEAYDGKICAGGATCPVEELRDKDARLELKTRTDHAEAQKTEHKVKHGKTRSMAADPVNCELLVSFELGRSQGQRTPWCVQNIREGLSEIHKLASAVEAASGPVARRDAFFEALDMSAWLKRTSIGVASISQRGVREGTKFINLWKDRDAIETATKAAFTSALKVHGKWVAACVEINQ